MELKRPRHNLERMKQLIRQGDFIVLVKAWKTASEDFGLDTRGQVAEAILTLSSRHFYKSMATYADHRVWQDVYHADVSGIPAYIKLRIDEDD
jgi:motility quorum-sensing regulator/GCU-specific mRNA interferase toxin